MPVIFEEAEIAGVFPVFVVRSEDDADYFRDSAGAPEAPLIEWAAQFVRNDPRAFFVDVGAHVGTWCITFAKLGVDVVGFEPQRAICRMCNQGFLLSKAKGECLPIALGEGWGEAILTAPYADGGGGSIVRTFDNPAITSLVYVQPLDDFVLSPSLIKIDAEGAELDVLRGGKKTIESNRPRIIFEVWQDELGQRKEELFRYLHDDLEYRTVPVSWRDTWLAEPRR